jgi:hypothetical protein
LCELDNACVAVDSGGLVGSLEHQAEIIQTTWFLDNLTQERADSMTAIELSLTYSPKTLRELHRHLVDLAIRSIELSNGDWRALPVDRPPPLS